MRFRSPHRGRSKWPPDLLRLASSFVLEVLEAGPRNWHPDLSLRRRLSLYLQERHQLLNGSLLPNLCPQWLPLLLRIAGLARRVQ